MSDNADLRAALIAALGQDAVLSTADDLAYYGTDRCRGSWQVQPSLIVLPRTVDEVQAVVRACAAHGVCIVPSGGRTGLTGGATAIAGEVVVSLERMKSVLEVDGASMTLRCEAGVTIGAVQDAANKIGLVYPVDFAAKGTAQVGGTIATNAGGVKVIRYGPTRNWVMAVRVVLASGEVLDTGGPLLKDNTGYDLKQLFVGAEGTLGIVVEATLRLCPPPPGAVVALCAVADLPRVLSLFTRVQRSGLTLQAFECFDAGGLAHVLAHRGSEGRGPFEQPSPQHALIEVEVPAKGDAPRELTVDALMEVLGEAQEADEITDAVLAQTPQQARDLWALREGISESLHSHRPHKADVTLPLAQLPSFVSAWAAKKDEHLADVEAVVFGHIGDGNLHLNLLTPESADPEAFRARCKAFDEHTYGLVRDRAGSISAEHGIGLLKRDHLHYSRDALEIDVMRTIRRALDPTGMFNPGKIFE
ncbi:MAG: FAD-binding oxidoreductase [Nannocystaceae bacterium]|nr:FAD-binding oxidoreductase [Nannocystaceae bacterium]